MQGASQTAVMTAVSRGAHHFMDPDPIFSDTYALALVGMSELEAVEFLRAAGPERLWHVARLFVCQRSRFVEEAVERAVADGVNQFVDVGAGLSSFAWRRTDLLQTLNVFEVDHPDTQSVKRQRVDAVGLTCPPNMHFVAVDFNAADSLADALTGAGFDASKPSIWSWLGVVTYRRVDAVRSTLAEVAALSTKRSTLVASFGVPDEFMEPASSEFAHLVRELVAKIGEPQVTWLQPEEMETIAREAHWRQVTSVDPASFAPWFAGRSDGLQPVRYEWLLVAEK
ncbi:methyltransferase, putative, TIGR00027 family [Mycobacterium sp. JS623]|uniref:class I SAM-dependent methyltransferase n=1 Tax=Mycobacterium sp. JS623 TaxID=212767 RepID=UPI0002A56094|nr:class I SAM-dependent methyltransferase [Mycobacterium sp. JS623]AGB23040.1 methyltransferase, putative, TIGR00027 family [Mycobacterium sp. JS623]